MFSGAAGVRNRGREAARVWTGQKKSLPLGQAF
jgi:hypothetical protein